MNKYKYLHAYILLKYKIFETMRQVGGEGYTHTFYIPINYFFKNIITTKNLEIFHRKILRYFILLLNIYQLEN